MIHMTRGFCHSDKILVVEAEINLLRGDSVGERCIKNYDVFARMQSD